MNQRINYEKVAQVALDYALTKAAVGAGFNWQHALMGAGLGAGAGALSGLVAPGKDDEDETDRSGSAIMRGLLGGALGGAAGGFGGKYLAPYIGGGVPGAAATDMTVDPARRAGRAVLKDLRKGEAVPATGDYALPQPLPNNLPEITMPKTDFNLASEELLGRTFPNGKIPMYDYLARAIQKGPQDAIMGALGVKPVTGDYVARGVAGLGNAVDKFLPGAGSDVQRNARRAALSTFGNVVLEPFKPKTILPKRR